MWRSSGGRMSPRDVDDLTLWEIAVLLGIGDETGAQDEPTTSDTGGRTARRPGSRKDYLRARIAHAKGEGPKPEARAMDPAAFQQITGALG